MAVDYYKCDEVASNYSCSRYGCLTGENNPAPDTYSAAIYRLVLFKISVPIRRHCFKKKKGKKTICFHLTRIIVHFIALALHFYVAI